MPTRKQGHGMRFDGVATGHQPNTGGLTLEEAS